MSQGSDDEFMSWLDEEVGDTAAPATERGAEGGEKADASLDDLLDAADSLLGADGEPASTAPDPGPGPGASASEPPGAEPRREEEHSAPPGPDEGESPVPEAQSRGQQFSLFDGDDEADAAGEGADTGSDAASQAIESTPGPTPAPSEPASPKAVPTALAVDRTAASPSTSASVHDSTAPSTDPDPGSRGDARFGALALARRLAACRLRVPHESSGDGLGRGILALLSRIDESVGAGRLLRVHTGTADDSGDRRPHGAWMEHQRTLVQAWARRSATRSAEPSPSLCDVALAHATRVAASTCPAARHAAAKAAIALTLYTETGGGGEGSGQSEILLAASHLLAFLWSPPDDQAVAAGTRARNAAAFRALVAFHRPLACVHLDKAFADWPTALAADDAATASEACTAPLPGGWPLSANAPLHLAVSALASVHETLLSQSSSQTDGGGSGSGDVSFNAAALPLFPWAALLSAVAATEDEILGLRDAVELRDVVAQRVASGPDSGGEGDDGAPELSVARLVGHVPRAEAASWAAVSARAWAWAVGDTTALPNGGPAATGEDPLPAADAEVCALEEAVTELRQGGDGARGGSLPAPPARCVRLAVSDVVREQCAYSAEGPARRGGAAPVATTFPCAARLLVVDCRADNAWTQGILPAVAHVPAATTVADPEAMVQATGRLDPLRGAGILCLVPGEGEAEAEDAVRHLAVQLVKRGFDRVACGVGTWEEGERLAADLMQARPAPLPEDDGGASRTRADSTAAAAAAEAATATVWRAAATLGAASRGVASVWQTVSARRPSASEGEAPPAAPAPDSKAPPDTGPAATAAAVVQRARAWATARLSQWPLQTGAEPASALGAEAAAQGPPPDPLEQKRRAVALHALHGAAPGHEVDLRAWLRGGSAGGSAPEMRVFRCARARHPGQGQSPEGAPEQGHGDGGADSAMRFLGITSQRLLVLVPSGSQGQAKVEENWPLAAISKVSISQRQAGVLSLFLPAAAFADGGSAADASEFRRASFAVPKHDLFLQVLRGRIRALRG